LKLNVPLTVKSFVVIELLAVKFVVPIVGAVKDVIVPLVVEILPPETAPVVEIVPLPAEIEPPVIAPVAETLPAETVPVVEIVPLPVETDPPVIEPAVEILPPETAPVAATVVAETAVIVALGLVIDVVFVKTFAVKEL
jgi:hypothetical protein